MGAKSKGGIALGLYINTLPVRVNVDPQDIRKCIVDMHNTLSEILEFEQAPLSEIQRYGSAPREAKLFNTLVNYRTHLERDVPSEELGIRILHSEEETTYPLSVFVDQYPDLATITLHAFEGYNAEAFSNSLLNIIKLIAAGGNNNCKANKIERFLQSVESTPEKEMRYAVNKKGKVASLPASELHRIQGNHDVEAIKLIWCEVLGVEQVSYEDNFFDLGGDSLSAVRVYSKLRCIGIKTSLRAIITKPILLEYLRTTKLLD